MIDLYLHHGRSVPLRFEDGRAEYLTVSLYSMFSPFIEGLHLGSNFMPWWRRSAEVLAFLYDPSSAGMTFQRQRCSE